MMKFLVLASVLGLSSAFAPQQTSGSVPTALQATEPLGAAPLMGKNTVFVGRTEWNKLTTEMGTEDTGKFLRAA